VSIAFDKVEKPKIVKTMEIMLAMKKSAIYKRCGKKKRCG
jgi:hypothetical protein